MDVAATTSQGKVPDIANLLEQRPGAVFLRADLQVHTPVDKRFDPGPEPKDAAERLNLAREYLRTALGRGIELVGITEHNDVSWIEELRAVAAELGLYLLPGFEVESAEGVHVLCLFDPNTAVSHLEDTMVRLGLTEAKRASNRLELRTDQHFADLLSLIQEESGGICIAAHIESNKGLWAALREGARVDAWKTKALLGAQVAKPPDEITSGNGRIIRGEEPIYERERLPGYVLTSDARSLEDIGTTSTWIKMDSVGVNGLRQAFLDPESRIRYDDPAERRKGARLLALAWEGDFLDGVRFSTNPELNCLIGGKGTGKSTAIESIRFAFDMPYRTNEVRRAAEELREHAFRSGSKISIAVETESPRHRYVVERTAPHAPVVRELDGTIRPDLDARTLLRPCIYGQKEIFGIAQNAEARLDMLDSFAAETLRDVRERERSLLDQLNENAAIITRTRQRIDDAESKLAELPNLEEFRARFRQAGFEDLLSERKQLDSEGRIFAAVRKALDGRRAQLSGIVEDGSLGAWAFADARSDDLPNKDLVDRAAEVVESADGQVTSHIEQAQNEITAAAAQLDAIKSEWATRREARTAEFDRALRELQTKLPDVDPERYLEVERRIEQLTPLRDALAELRERIKLARASRESLLIELNDARGEKHRVRDRASTKLNDALAGNVLIDLTHQGVRGSFVEELMSLKTGTRQDALRRLVDREDFTPVAFAEAVRGRQLTSTFDVPSGQAASLERALDEETLLRLETLELPDQVQLSLDVALGEGRHDYRELSRLSPGQKSTAILLLVMQESEDPLLIDQPEDDLDNRFIYDDIVKRLRAAKPARQFLIATHNANIPVLGDAEQIVALDAEETSTGGSVSSLVRAQGSIDAQKIREAAEHILEGGREAFALRQAKYEA